MYLQGIGQMDGQTHSDSYLHPRFNTYCQSISFMYTENIASKTEQKEITRAIGYVHG